MASNENLAPEQVLNNFCNAVEGGEMLHLTYDLYGAFVLLKAEQCNIYLSNLIADDDYDEERLQALFIIARFCACLMKSSYLQNPVCIVGYPCNVFSDLVGSQDAFQKIMEYINISVRIFDKYECLGCFAEGGLWDEQALLNTYIGYRKYSVDSQLSTKVKTQVDELKSAMMAKQHNLKAVQKLEEMRSTLVESVEA